MKNNPGNSAFRCFALLALLVGFVSVYAQKPVAPVRVVVTDMKGKIRSGETIIFTDTVSGRSFSGVTDVKGEFRLDLPSGAVYRVTIRTIGEVIEHTRIEIPDLKPGEYFDGESIVTIQFEPEKRFRLDAVHFDSGKATLRPESTTELNELVDYLKLKPSVKIEIAGHTDDVGDDQANLKLSHSRADAVKAYLVKKGIAANRVVAKGYGESKPVASNDTPEGRQKNRRTEVIILSE